MRGENLQKGANGEVGFEIEFEFTDGTTETRFGQAFIMEHISKDASPSGGGTVAAVRLAPYIKNCSGTFLLTDIMFQGGSMTLWLPPLIPHVEEIEWTP